MSSIRLLWWDNGKADTWTGNDSRRARDTWTRCCPRRLPAPARAAFPERED
jgi:hypothetical protein